MMHVVYLGLGSNLGNREELLQRAIRLLDSNRYIDVKKTSSFIESFPKGTDVQPLYLNGACMIETLLTPDELLYETQMIEKVLGRQSKGDYAPRFIDIDILMYDDLVYATDDLIIPHPLMHERGFVLKPLSDIEPLLNHPILNETVLCLYSNVS